MPMGGGEPVGNWTDFDNYDISWYVGHESDSSYTISTAEELAGLSYLVTLASTKVTFNGKVIALDNIEGVIDLSMHYWTPIGDDSDMFEGTFDGQYNIIKGLYIGTEASPAGDYLGPFGSLGSTGTIKNLGVVGGKIYGYYTVAGIVGYSEGVVENCFNTNDLSGYGSIAGIVGFLNGGNITNCYNAGNLSGSLVVAGIVGLVGGGYITNCYSRGEITRDFGHSPLWGILFGSISNCYWPDYLGFPLVPGESLSIEEMTGIDAVNTMNFGPEWETRENGGEMYFFPQLKGFSESDNPIVREYSLESVTVGTKTEPTITQSEPYTFTVGQKLSDIDPKTYVSVPSGVEGTFSWEDPDRMLDTAGDFTAKIIFTPTDTVIFFPTSIDADITVKVPGPSPEPSSGMYSYLFFVAAIIVGLILFYIGVVKEE